MSWDSLPPDLAHVIAGRIRRHADYLRFRSACSAWRSATSPSPSHLPRQLPFLLLPSLSFHSPSENRSYKIPSLYYSSCQLIGSSHGWLFLLGPSTSMSLFNPFQRAVVSLPPLVEVPNLFDLVNPADVERYRASMDKSGGRSAVGFWKYLVRKGKLCWDGEGSSGVWVAIAFPKSGLALYRAGDKSWAHAGRYWRFADAELHNGKLYAITLGGILSTIDLSISPFKETVVVSSPPFQHNQHVDVSLFNSALDKELLLLLVRKYEGGKTIGFEVFRLEMEKETMGWTRVERLLDEAVFVGKGGTVSVPVLGLEGFEGNCVWFTEEFEEGEKGDLDVGCFGLDSGGVKRVGFGKEGSGCGWSGCEWVTPCLW